ncbi:MAG TPA: molybdopterin cofactor-binding domain-containing protein, partial [Bryobacteraceae bacterium]|nr:molybdopterin cofactor-binding domain-containing protein [Bryobacteraceae bacterium]
ETLIDLAAETLPADRAALKAADGRISDGSNRSIAYAGLTRGRKLMKSIEDAPTTPPAAWQVCGRSAEKVDGRAMVTGRHAFASDIQRPGMLHGKVLRPAAFGATLASVDLEAARSMPGVVVAHEGDFAGVAAPTGQAADKALAALRAEWNTKPQPSGRDLAALLRGRSEPGTAVSATYTVAYIAHVPLEPRAAVAEWSGGRLTVWTGTQRPFGVRAELAEAFGIPEGRIRVIVPDMGSGYGGKHTGEAAIEAARLAKAAGKPVKLVWTREEEFTWAYFRPAGVIDITAAAGPDGRLTKWEFHNYNSGASGIRTPYEVPHPVAEYHRSPSPLRQGSYRALASTANHFARESHMDDLAHAARMDPLEFRLKNLKDARLRAVLEAAAEAFGWGRTRSSAERACGIAVGTEKGGYVSTCAEVSVRGGAVTVDRIVSAFECGAILNPDHLKNQIEGAMVMGLGGALFESVEFENGRILNARLSKYRVPRFSDAPSIETVLLDRRDLPSAGAGESPLIALAPAIGNAIFQATGERRRSLPMVRQ